MGGDELIAGSGISETLRGCPHDRTLRPCRRRRRAVTGSCLLTAQPDPTRSGPKTGPAADRFRSTGGPLLRSSGKKDFPAAWLEALRYRPECNQTVGWLPECGRTRIENRQRNLNRASCRGLASRQSWTMPTGRRAPYDRLRTGGYAGKRSVSKNISFIK